MKTTTVDYKNYFRRIRKKDIENIYADKLLLLTMPCSARPNCAFIYNSLVASLEVQRRRNAGYRNRNEQIYEMCKDGENNVAGTDAQMQQDHCATASAENKGHSDCCVV